MMKFKLQLILILLFSFGKLGLSQNAPQFGSPDNPEGRSAWELKRLADPETGKIPSHMRERELMFAKTLPRDNEIFNRAENINWHSRGPWNVGGITRALAMDVNDENTLLAGTNAGGVWRTTNGGQTWTQITPKDDYHGITCISQDKRPGHTNVWYFGSGDPYCSASAGGAFYSGNGVYKSLDNGLTWSQLSSTASPALTFDSNWDVIYKVIAYHKDTINDVVFAATYGNIFKSINGGNTWTVVKGNGTSFWTDVNVTPNGVVYATLGSDGGGKGIWRSPDGVNFTNITPPNFATTYERIVSTYTPTNENVVYFLANTPGFGTPDTNYLGNVEWNSLWKYTYLSGNGDSAGGIWEDLSNSLPTHGGPFDKFSCQGSYDLVIKVKPDDPNVVFIGGTNLYRSTNGFADASTNRFVGGYKEGTTLPIVLGYDNHHPDQHEILFYPSDPNKMLSGNDGGVFRTNNCMQDTMQWTSLDNGYLTTMFYTLAIDHGTPGNDIVIGGAQDNGSWFTNDTVLTNPWVTPRGGDGSFCAIADGRTSYYFSIQNGKMMKANVDNNGNITSYARIDPIGPGDSYEFINPFALDPNNNNIMYLAGGKYLWKNSDLSGIPMINNWDSISTNWSQWPDSVPVANATVTALGISKNPANRVYYGTSKKRLYRVDNANSGTPSPFDVTSSITPNVFPANGFINCVAVDPDDADKVMVVFSNYSVYSVYYSENGGARWRKVAGNLEQTATGSGNGPSVRWASIIHPPQGGTAYLLGTSTGLYATVNLDSTNTIWVQLAANDIGKVVVSMMDYRESDGRLLVATHSSGMYSTYITNVEQIPNLTNLKKISNEYLVGIYPNPTSGMVNVDFSIEKDQKVGFSIFDAMGRAIHHENPKKYASGKHIIKQNLNHLPKGTYYLKINFDDKEINKLLVLE
ncbi:MAG TPA: T9SS type A sorting domain-containing protein [Bacteroidia bacterium]|nr:T9SS type A sorting domain-containing protein [Bacteroidia bacterium]